MRLVRIGGIALHYQHHPEPAGRPLLVFVNSLGTDFRIWSQVADELGADFPTLCYDKRGHGLSDLGRPPYSMADHAADLAGLVEHAGGVEHGVVLVGLSVGGMIAQRLAVERPEMVRALVLCDTAHRVGTATFWEERIAAVERDGISAIADGILERWFTTAFHSGQPERLAGCRNMLVRQPTAGYAGTCAALRDADQTELVGRIAVPTLCLVGDQDGSTPPDLVEAMARLIPGASFAVIANAGHIPRIEQPEELVARIREFLRAEGLP